MKSTRFLLLLLIAVFTFNMSLQAEEPELPILENTGTTDLTICVTNEGFDGILYMYVGNQSLYKGYWGDGYMLMKSVGQDHIMSLVNPSPGDRIRIWASINNVGYMVDTAELEVPEIITSPCLYISVLYAYEKIRISASIR